MKKDFYLDLTKPDVNHDFFSEDAIQAVADQIVNLSITLSKPPETVLGEVEKAEVLNDGTIRVTGDFRADVDIPKNDIGSILYDIKEFELNGNTTEVKSSLVHKVYLIEDGEKLEMHSEFKN